MKSNDRAYVHSKMKNYLQPYKKAQWNSAVVKDVKE